MDSSIRAPGAGSRQSRGQVDTFGVNVGLISGVLNFAVMIVVSKTVRRGHIPLPARAWRRARPTQPTPALVEESG